MVKLTNRVGCWRRRGLSACLLGKVSSVCAALVLVSVGLCTAETLSQMNFEKREMAPWQTFVTPNGTVGETGRPMVVLFETAEEGQASQSLKFKVGQARYEKDTPPEQGGGLVILMTTEAGTLHLSADVAATYYSPNDRRNLAGGLFQWIVDDHVIASHDIGPIKKNGLIRHHFKTQHPITTGPHRIRLRITRPFTSLPGKHAPFQYVDNLLLGFSPHP